jgi:hypothetical protein
VAKIKLKSKREYIRLTDVANAYKCDVTPEELFSEAAIGELTIYVDLDQDQAVIVLSAHLMKQMPQTDGETLIDKESKPPADKDFRNMYKESKIFYRYTLFGYQPILSSVFENDNNDRGSKQIGIGIGKSLTGKDGKQIFFQTLLVHHPSVTLQEALDDRKLYVMKSDVEQMLIEESSAPAVAKPKVAASKKTIKGPRSETLECQAEWERRALEIMKTDPTLSKSEIANSMALNWGKEMRRCYRAANTIRQHLKNLK